jgi:sec-independent protein translocase protein TatB
MLDIGPSELLLIAIVAVIAIGPKELPAALRTIGRWIGQMRRMSAHFRTGVDAMIREAEMAELEKKWTEQNAKIMREHPADAPPEMEPTGAFPARPSPPEPPPASAEAKVVTSDKPDERRDMSLPNGKPEA